VVPGALLASAGLELPRRHACPHPPRHQQQVQLQEVRRLYLIYLNDTLRGDGRQVGRTRSKKTFRDRLAKLEMNQRGTNRQALV
jgi:hypothetical protein